ncbi:MAG: manganese efflux pump [Candidatus Eremiobacteraeota bacterium]|nr:manganese efflux pump [Candidatus Eremiobacteraeota bacterium]
MNPHLKVALVAVSVALDVFAVCVGVGVRPLLVRERARIGVAFATAEIAMSLIGVGLGQVIGKAVGEFAAYLGFGALLVVGIAMVLESLKEERGELDLSSGWGLFIAALSISLDSLGVGFSLLYIGVPLIESLAAIFGVSLVATATGLALGRQIGVRVGGAAGLAAGVILIAIGLGFGLLHYFGSAG